MCYHSVKSSCKPDFMPPMLSGRSIGVQVIEMGFKAWLNGLISLMPGHYRMVKPHLYNRALEGWNENENEGSS